MVKGCFCFDIRPGSLIVVWFHIILATFIVVGGFYYAAIIHGVSAMALVSIHMHIPSLLWPMMIVAVLIILCLAFLAICLVCVGSIFASFAAQYFSSEIVKILTSSFGGIGILIMAIPIILFVLEIYFTAVVVAMYRKMTTKSPENAQVVISHQPMNNQQFMPMTHQQIIPMTHQQIIPMTQQQIIPIASQPNVQDMHAHQGSLMTPKMSAFNA